MAVIRVSFISKGLSKISQDYIDDVANKRATHVTFHANNISSLTLKHGQELKHLVDLDLSSNSLHNGYELPTFSVDRRISLLECCRNLTKLNLQSNLFTSKSFETFVSRMPELSHLITIDISHNNISKLPPGLQQKCPSLRNLAATSNRIKSLSNLLRWLHQFRGQLECITLGSSNPVCSSPLYREKVIYVVGGLIQLDSRIISDDEREKVRVRLSIYSNSAGGKDDEEDASRLPSDSDHERDDEQKQYSSDIENRVDFLSNLIEKQAHITNGLLEVTQSRNENEIDERIEDSGEDGGVVETQLDNAATISALRRTSASTRLELILVQQCQRRLLLRLPFYRWLSAARFSRHLLSLQSKFTKSENKWRDRANEMVEKEQRKGIAACRELAEEKKLAEEQVSQLSERVKELEMNIKVEQSKSATSLKNSTRETDQLRNELHRAHTMLKRIEDDEKEKNRLSAVELESIRAKLHRVQKDLQHEKGDNARLESMYKDLTKATQEARDTSTAHTAELHELKIEIVTKDATIKQLKAAYEQAASRAASDRSKCEHALAGERRKGEMIKSYTKKLRSLESDKQKLVALRTNLEAAAATSDSQLTSMQQAVREQAAQLLKLNDMIEEKECKIDSLDRRLKYVSVERDDSHQQLIECKKAMDQLKSQLDRSSEAHRFETMKLQQTLDTLRLSSQQREQELSAELKLLQRECQDKTAKQAKVIKSLGNKLKGYETRGSELEQKYKSGMQQLRNELKSVQDTLTDERKLRLDAEKKAASLEAIQHQQQSKMKNAIADLAKEFTSS